MMPHSSQCLYFHLGMNADDDGFCEHFTLMRMTESKPDDLKILQAKGFVYVFDEQVLVILDWQENNAIRSDRYSKSKYIEIYREELKLLSDNQMSTTCQPDVIPMVTTGKISIDKVSIDKVSIDKIEEKFPAEIISITQNLYDILVKPTRWNKKPPDLKRWCEDIDKLNRIDGINFELINSVIDFIDKYDKWKWKEVIQSGHGFRKHFDTIEKQMKKNRVQTKEDIQADKEYYEKRIKELQNETH